MDIVTENNQVVQKYLSDNILHDDYFKNSSKIDIPATGIYPLKIDNRQLCSPTDYQGDKPWCVGYSCAQLLEAYIWKYTGVLKNLDAAQIYAKAKAKDGKLNVGGTYVDLGLNCAMSIVNNELIKKWFMVKTLRDQNPNKLKRVIHMNDLAIAGFAITDAWYNLPSDFIVRDTGKDIGGHAVLICGYDETGVYIQNHWGKGWGAMGFCILPWNLYQHQLMQLCWLESKA